MPITIKELLASDTISQASDKVNFNFDQLLLNGGGPVGPPGPLGPPGPIGGRGIRGSHWYEDPSGAAGTLLDPGDDPNTIPSLLPNAIANDNYLQANGEVWEYNGSVWIDTGVNLQGEQGIPGTSEDWRRFGAPPTLNAGNNVLTPVMPSTIPTIPAGTVDNNIFPVSLGGMPESIFGVANGYAIDTNIAQNMTSGNGAFGASLYIHVPGAPDHINAIKFSGANQASPDDYCFDEENLATVGLDIGDRLVIQDSQKVPVSLANIYGLELKTFNKNMFMNIGKGLDLRTGMTSLATLPAQTSEIKLWVTQKTPLQVGESDIILLNDETGLITRAEFRVGTTNTTVTSTNTANIWGSSARTYFNVNETFRVQCTSTWSSSAIDLQSPNGGSRFKAGKGLFLDGNWQLDLESTSGPVAINAGTTITATAKTGIDIVNITSGEIIIKNDGGGGIWIDSNAATSGGITMRTRDNPIQMYTRNSNSLEVYNTGTGGIPYNLLTLDSTGGTYKSRLIYSSQGSLQMYNDLANGGNNPLCLRFLDVNQDIASSINVQMQGANGEKSYTSFVNNGPGFTPVTQPSVDEISLFIQSSTGFEFRPSYDTAPAGIKYAMSLGKSGNVVMRGDSTVLPQLIIKDATEYPDDTLRLETTVDFASDEILIEAISDTDCTNLVIQNNDGDIRLKTSLSSNPCRAGDVKRIIVEDIFTIGGGASQWWMPDGSTPAGGWYNGIFGNAGLWLTGTPSQNFASCPVERDQIIGMDHSDWWGTVWGDSDATAPGLNFGSHKAVYLKKSSTSSIAPTSYGDVILNYDGHLLGGVSFLGEIGGMNQGDPAVQASGFLSIRGRDIVIDSNDNTYTQTDRWCRIGGGWKSQLSVRLSDDFTTTGSGKNVSVQLGNGFMTNTGDSFLNFDYNRCDIATTNIRALVVGTLPASGYNYAVMTYSIPSDIRLKENVEKVPSLLDKIAEIDIIDFDWKWKSDKTESVPGYVKGTEKRIGFVAQQIADIFPSTVQWDSFESEELEVLGKTEEWGKANNKLCMRDTDFNAILVKGIQELKAENDELKERLKLIEEKLGL